MRFLFISNFYPPVSRGGFEQWCQEVGEGLQSRGHDVHVLTSRYRRALTGNADPDWVHRDLHLEMEISSLRNAVQFFTLRRRRERENLARTRSLLDAFQPDVALVWGMWNLHHSVPALLETQLSNRVAYYMGDYWPTLPSPFEDYWNAPPRNAMTGIPKALLKPIAKAILLRDTRPSLRFEYMMFPSKFMRDEFAAKKIVSNHARVVYGAIDTEKYLRSHKESRDDQAIISLLFVGRLSKEKGVHTAIRAMGLLTRTHGLQNIQLTIVGNGEPEYESFLREMANKEGVEQIVRFIPTQPKESLPSLYRTADIFLFTSIWAEPFGRVLVEAMASGVPVIGTSVGGAAEILIENETALTFLPDDPISLASQIKRLIDLPGLRRRLAKAARETAVSKFDINRMTDEIGDYLGAIART